MICSCGGLTRNHETKHAYVHTCNACGRRHEVDKVGANNGNTNDNDGNSVVRNKAQQP